MFPNFSSRVVLAVNLNRGFSKHLTLSFEKWIGFGRRQGENVELQSWPDDIHLLRPGGRLRLCRNYSRIPAFSSSSSKVYLDDAFVVKLADIAKESGWCGTVRPCPFPFNFPEGRPLRLGQSIPAAIDWT